MTYEDMLRLALRVGLTFELPPTKLLQFAQEVRQRTKEEAAQLCEEFDVCAPKHIATAIRNMK